MTNPAHPPEAEYNALPSPSKNGWANVRENATSVLTLIGVVVALFVAFKADRTANEVQQKQFRVEHVGRIDSSFGNLVESFVEFNLALLSKEKSEIDSAKKKLTINIVKSTDVAQNSTIFIGNREFSDNYVANLIDFSALLNKYNNIEDWKTVVESFDKINVSREMLRSKLAADFIQNKKGI